MMIPARAFLLCLCLSLAACSGGKSSMPSMKMPKMPRVTTLFESKPTPPARIEKYGDRFYGSDSGEPLSIEESERLRQRKLYKVVAVQKGDTLYDIAERYNLESRDIIEYNDLKPPYRLKRGESLKLPRAQFYAVQPGDSLYKVSQKKGVDMSRLAEINKLQEPYGLEPGMRLRLPFRTHWGSAAGSEMETASAVSVGDVEVAELEDIDSARKAAPRKDFSGKYKPRTVRYVLTRPDGSEVEVEKTETVEAAPVEVASLPSKVAEEEAPAPAVRESRPKAPLPKMNGRAPSGFSWPIKGKVIAGFGAGRGGVYNDGINIAAPVGTAVKAAADGVVIYAGDGLEGYGNLVIVKHNGGWISSYAHNKDILVRRGDKVKRGQTISKVGESGRVNKPQLHFGLRKGRKVVNPADHLSG